MIAVLFGCKNRFFRPKSKLFPIPNINNMYILESFQNSSTNVREEIVIKTNMIPSAFPYYYILVNCKLFI
jgi:hypothetical protein